MTDEEVEIVAQELAKIGGTSWYPGREPGALLRKVSERYRDQARALIRAFDNLHQRNAGNPPDSGDASHPQGGLMR